MKYILTIITALLLCQQTSAQCEIENTAFQSGETLVYTLKFNWQFVWIDVGTATMVTRRSIYNGVEGYRCSLITRGNRAADRLFVMRDTLVSVVDSHLRPLYFRKGANEAHRYRVDEVWYNYEGGRSVLTQRYRNPRGVVTETQNDVTGQCVTDMLSMFMRARSFDASTWVEGQRMTFLMADGDEVEEKILVFRRREVFKMESTGKEYNCIVMSFVERDERGREKDVITFYVSDDENHLPLRLDLNLRFGSAKAFLTGKRGVRHPMTSERTPRR